MPNPARPKRLLLGIVLAVAALWAADKVAFLYVDYLWFDSLGFASVFTTELATKAVLGVGAFLLTALWLGGNVYAAARLSPGRYFVVRLPWVMTAEQFLSLVRLAAKAAVVIVAYIAAKAAAAQWYEVLQFLNRSTFVWADPVLATDASFYVFVMPALELARTYVLAMAVLAAGGTAAAYFMGGGIGWPHGGAIRGARLHLGALVALALAAVGLGYWLGRFDLLLSSHGAVIGAGYVDVHVRMPALTILAVASAATAVVVMAAAVRNRLRGAAIALLILAAMHFIGVWSYPSFTQRFDVEPNELVREEPYLANSIKATRFAFGLDTIESRPYSAKGTLTLKEVEKITGTVDNIRIWDWQVLLSTYNQIESLRPYYHFNDVDVDRYAVGGRPRQVTLAVRELDASLLNQDSRTWVNLHLLYTHGYGACLSPVNAVTPEGLPELWIGNIPPQIKIDLPITRPEIYFGELTRSYIFTHTTQKEFDYPLGAENSYAEYQGDAGVAVDSFARRLLFAYYFSDWNILLTDSFRPETRVLWARQIRHRVGRLAPFLKFDGDPYPVLLEGRVVWVLDAYTMTNRFPYSAATPFEGAGDINYLRNSVKAVVDAYDGSVAFYVMDRSDPLALAAQSTFPALFRSGDEMPPALRPHLRYPEDLFDTQARQFLAYHMTDPRIFYNKEDLWQRPHHVTGDRRKAIDASYLIMTLPGEKQPEFILMLPFTPARKDNMVAWMAARCDGKNYGKAVVYTFPKDHLIFGPNQVEARINQNDEISPQITLWSQHGSHVVRGNLLVIPVGDSILYVQPLYLKSENAAIPELKRIIVSYQERIAMRNTLSEALEAVFGAAPAGPRTPATRPAAPPEQPPPAPPDTPLKKRALELFDKAMQQQRDGDWAGYGTTNAELGKVLKELVGERSK